MAAIERLVCLVDTNVLVYAYDRSAPQKQHRAFGVLDRLHQTRSGALSAQVLGEFFYVLTRKLTPPFRPDFAGERVDRLLGSWPVLPLTGPVVREAVRGTVEHKLSYYDAQIWAVAHLNQLPVVLSEDFTDGAVIDGVRFLNPFKDGFDLDRL